MNSTATATRPRPTFTPPPADDPRPWIPKPPAAAAQPLPTRPQPHERDGRQPAPEPARPHSRPSAVVSPAEFLAAHPDIASWSGVEHDVYRHLVEVSRIRLTPQHLYAEARIAQNAARNLIDSIWDLPKDERPPVKAEARALYATAADLYAAAEDAELPILTEPLSPAGITALARVEARIAATAVVRTPGRVAEVVSLLNRQLPRSRRWRVERRLEGVVAERAALIGVAA